MQHGVPLDLLGEFGQLLLVRQFAVDQQVADLDEGRLLGELLDRVTAIAQDPRVAVDVGDGALGGRRVDEAVVEGRVTGLGQQWAQRDAVGPFGGVDDFQVQLSTRVIEGGGVVGCGHGNPFALACEWLARLVAYSAKVVVIAAACLTGGWLGVRAHRVAGDARLYSILTMP